MSDPDQRTLAIYDARAGEYAKLTENDGAPKLQQQFARHIPQGGKILDYGCGPGFAASYFAELGYDVDAFDGSLEMVMLAKTRPHISVRHLTFQAFSAPNTYDGIWASFSLLHAPRSEFPTLLRTIHQALRPSGQLFLGMKLGSGEHRDDLGRLYSYYSEQELRERLKETGFHWRDHQLGSGKGLDGSHSEWILIFAHA